MQRLWVFGDRRFSIFQNSSSINRRFYRPEKKLLKIFIAQDLCFFVLPRLGYGQNPPEPKPIPNTRKSWVPNPLYTQKPNFFWVLITNFISKIVFFDRNQFLQTKKFYIRYNRLFFFSKSLRNIRKIFLNLKMYLFFSTIIITRILLQIKNLILFF